MSVYENLKHGTADFPLGVHDTKCGKGFSLYPHIHREFEILVLEKGCGRMHIEGVEYELREGDGVFINSHKLHLGTAADNLSAEFFAIVFSPEIFGSFGNDLVMNKYVLPVMENKISFPTLFCKEEPWQKRVIDLARQIHRSPSELMIKARLFEIWQLCFERGVWECASEDKAMEEMKAALEYIRTEYASNLSLSDIASRINMSKGHFCRKFSAVMHMTPFEYLLRIRIDNSCRMLRNSDLPISEIAAHCGFNSFSYFTKKFRENLGCTPTEYRKRGTGKL